MPNVLSQIATQLPQPTLAPPLQAAGETLRGLVEQVQRGALEIEFGLVISSSTRARGVEFARQTGIPCCVVEPRETPRPRFDEQIAELLADARALVAPSIWYENQPMVILEAFAAGVPVIGSRLGGIPELVADGERGVLAAPGSAHELADAIRLLHKDGAKAVSMGQAAREYVTRNHSVAGHLETIGDIYRHVTDPVSQQHAVAG